MKSLIRAAERSTIAEVSASLGTDALIELFEIDLGSVALTSPTTGLPVTDVLRFHAGTNNIDKPIVWQGNVYDPFPVQITGFEQSGTTQIPRPHMSVANITTSASGTGWGFISNLTRDFDDLVGVKVTRKRTYGRYLDNFCIKTDGSVVGGYCTDATYNDSQSDCVTNLEGWTTYNCSTCAADGTWYVNNKSTFELSVDPNLTLATSSTNQHIHSISLSSPEVCTLADGTNVTVTTNSNTYTTASIEILSVGVSGEVNNFSITGGSGYNSSDPIYIKSLLAPIVTPGFNSIPPAHIHGIDATQNETFALVENPGSVLNTYTDIIEGHLHAISITYNAASDKFIATFSDPGDNHLSGVPHTFVDSTATAPSFAVPILNSTGGLASITLMGAGAGLSVESDVNILLPTPAIHTHAVELEYLYEGTDEPKLVDGFNSTFEGATTNWYTSIGTTITSTYNSFDTGYNNVLRIESDGISNYAFIDIDTITDKEYNISFNYKVIVGSTQKILVESDNGDGTWTTEFTETLTGTGWQTYSKTVFTKDITRVPRTRFEIFSSGTGGGSLDELLIDNFQVKQTWVRGDAITRSIATNHGHTLTPYNKFVVDTSDHTAFFADDIFFIDRKVAETKIMIEFELAPAWDVEGIRLPKREIVQNTCLWKYRDGNCPYSGSKYYNKEDEPIANTGSNLKDDVCAKKLKSCELRFSTAETAYTTKSTCEAEGFYWNVIETSCWDLNKAELPYGGFPGVGLGLR